ncbi:MAG: PorV/PorQ family protein [Bacteroidales bacterium]|nr:PorV/PorQ family protein [Bacteroidales bacterium]
MRTPKLFLAAFAALTIGAVAAKAQGEDAFPFVRADVNPVTVGKAFAGSANTESIAFGAFNNSAVIPFFGNTFDVAASFQSWAPDGAKTTKISAGAGYRINNRIGVALAFSSLSGESYDIYNDAGVETGSFTPKSMMLAAGLGFALTEQLSAGLNFKYARQEAAKADVIDAFGGDLMLYYKPAPGFGLTAGVASLFANIKDDMGNSYKLPASARLAGDYTYLKDDNAFTADVDLDYFLSGNFCVAAGAQYGYKDMLFVRAGYHYGPEKAVLPSFASVGCGVKFSGVRIDFAYLTANKDLGNTITVGLGYTF